MKEIKLLTSLDNVPPGVYQLALVGTDQFYGYVAIDTPEVSDPIPVIPPDYFFGQSPEERAARHDRMFPWYIMIGAACSFLIGLAVWSTIS